MASGLHGRWKIDGETVETVIDFIFLGSKITADGNCSHEIKRCLLLGRRSLVGYSPRGRKESDTTERLHLTSPTPWKESYDQPR